MLAATDYPFLEVFWTMLIFFAFVVTHGFAMIYAFIMHIGGMSGVAGATMQGSNGAQKIRTKSATIKSRWRNHAAINRAQMIATAEARARRLTRVLALRRRTLQRRSG